MKEIALHILDLIQNSTRANASIIEITIEESKKRNIYSCTITDNGLGIPPDILSNILDPYTTTRTTRNIGLGLSLIQMNTINAGGNLTIESKINQGTRLHFWFEHNHWNRPPLGDIEGVITLLSTQNINIQYIYKHTTDNGDYIFDSKAVIEILDGMPLNSYLVFSQLKTLIRENINAINAEE
jgi:hypothetical protein